MIVTTSARRQQDLTAQAKQAARELSGTFVPRGKLSVKGILETYAGQDILMVTKDGLKLFPQHRSSIDGDKEPFFFHPSSAMFRLKRLIRGEHDPFVEATGLQQGMSVLDTTLGLASDAIVAAHVVGEHGRVIGIESERVLAYIVEQGLHSWITDMKELETAMKRIEVIQGDHVTLLQQYEDKSFDVIYFDPMFETSVMSSTGMTGLKQFANYEPLTPEAIAQAKRVARKRVIMKESSYSLRFKEFGFEPIERKYASHWFGVIELI